MSEGTATGLPEEAKQAAQPSEDISPEALVTLESIDRIPFPDAGHRKEQTGSWNDRDSGTIQEPHKQSASSDAVDTVLLEGTADVRGEGPRGEGFEPAIVLEDQLADGRLHPDHPLLRGAQEILSRQLQDEKMALEANLREKHKAVRVKPSPE